MEIDTGFHILFVNFDVPSLLGPNCLCLKITNRSVTKTLIGWWGWCIFIYSCFAQQISFRIDEFEI